MTHCQHGHHLRQHLNRGLQKAQELWCGVGAKAAGFIHRLARPEMAGARHDDRAREEARLLESGEEFFRLRRRIDDVVFAAIDQKKTGAVLVDCHLAEW